MKKILSFFLAVSMITLTFSACSGADGGGNNTINVCNWGEYISNGTEGSVDVIKEFEEETGIKVVYSTFKHNEELLTKMSSGGVSYDVIIPSDYMIGKMIESDMLEKINFDNVPNFEKIGSDYKNLDYDPTNEYSVPYTWGTVGIIYNKKFVTKNVDSWDILWDEEYANKILMFENSRDAFAISMFRKGYNLNSVNESEWKDCAEDLKAQKPLVQSYVMDEIFDKMANEEAWIAPYYAGDAITMKESNENLEFVFPKEGTNYFVDAMCIPKTSKNKEAAEKFINFMCEPRISAANANFTTYASPISEAVPLSDNADNPIAYPSSDILSKTQVFKSLPAAIDKLQMELWTEVKAS